MPIRIIINTGGNKRRILRLDPGDTLVGRHEDCRLRVPSAEVSRRHCVLRVKNDRLIVLDLDSANGTLLNGHFIEGKEEAGPGDEIQVGPITMVVDYKPSMATGPTKVDVPERSTPLEPKSKSPVNSNQPTEPHKRGRLRESEDLFIADLVEEEEGLVPANSDVIVEGVELVDEHTHPVRLPRKGNLRDLLHGLEDDSNQPLK
jgi:pSer/pThr/pTyr-binding forkhead associated (FHA) protein